MELLLQLAAVVFAVVISIMTLFAIMRIFTIEEHLRRLVYIAEHQAGLKPKHEFVEQ